VRPCFSHFSPFQVPIVAGCRYTPADPCIRQASFLPICASFPSAASPPIYLLPSFLRSSHVPPFLELSEGICASPCSGCLVELAPPPLCCIKILSPSLPDKFRPTAVHFLVTTMAGVPLPPRTLFSFRQILSLLALLWPKVGLFSPPLSSSF